MTPSALLSEDHKFLIALCLWPQFLYPPLRPSRQPGYVEGMGVGVGLVYQAKQECGASSKRPSDAPFVRTSAELRFISNHATDI